MKNYAKKALSAALALLMCLTVFALDFSGLTASAATDSPTHTFKLRVLQTGHDNNYDGQDNGGKLYLYAKNQNGTGSQTTLENGKSIGTGWATVDGGTTELGEWTSSYWPTSITIGCNICNNGENVGRKRVYARIDIAVKDGATGSYGDWKEFGSFNLQSNTKSGGGGSAYKSSSVSCNDARYPAATKIATSASASGDTTYNFTLNETGGASQSQTMNAYVYDQYNVIWRATPSSWSLSADSVTSSNTSTGCDASLSTTAAGESCKVTMTATKRTVAKKSFTVTVKYGSLTKKFIFNITPKFKINYNVSTNGGTSNAPSYGTVNNTTSNTSVSYTIPTGTLYTAVKNTEAGGSWTFVGWNGTSTATTGTAAGGSITIDSYNDTLYAIFSKKSTANFYWYNANGARQSSSQEKTIFNNAATYTFSFPDIPNSFVANGVTYTFIGWAQDSASATAVTSGLTNDNTSYTVNLKNSATYKFYALYKGTVKLSYNLNGGVSSAPVSQQSKELVMNCGNNSSAADNTSGRATFTINPDNRTLTRSYSTKFLGWNTNQTAAQNNELATYEDGTVANPTGKDTEITIAKDTTLYAVFYDMRYTAKFYDYDGTLKKTQPNIRHNYNATAPAMNTDNARPDHQDANNHYVFNRWEYADGSQYTDNDHLTAGTDGYVYNIYAGYIGHSHLFGDPYNVTGEQTCYSGSTYYRKCTVCGYERMFTEEQLEHQGEIIGETAPTCTESGSYGRMICINCGTELEYIRNINGADVVITDANRTIPPLGHAYGVKDAETGVWTLVPTDPETGALILKNAETGEYNVEPYEVSATCTASGYYYYKCANNEDHVVRVGTMLPVEHTWVEHPEVPADCTTPGMTGYSECSVCGSLSATPRVIPALGHKLTHFEANAPTCQADGNIEYYFCETCGKYFTDAEAAAEIVDVVDPETEVTVTIAEQIAIPAVPHAYETVSGKAPTCTEPGYTEASLCVYCGQVEPDTAPSGEVPALGHVWDRVGFDGFDTYADVYGAEYVETFTSEQPCVTPSSVTYICPDCGEKCVDEDALADHEPTHHAAVDASCTAAGNIEYWTCDVCHKYFSDAACTAEIVPASVVIAKGAHSMTRFDGRAADCENAGVSEYYYCSNCEKYYADINGETELETQIVDGELIILTGEIPALGHDCSEWVLAKAPTCDANGAETCVCARCSKVFRREVAALGHAVDALEAKDATCTEPGNISAYKCLNCGKYFSDAECENELAETDVILPATGHSYDVENPETDVPATCIEDGRRVYVCVNCGDEIVIILAATGEHPEDALVDFGDAADATCSALGQRPGKKCSICGTVISKPSAIPMLEHEAAEELANKANATCTENGYTGDVVCAFCGTVLEAGSVIQKKGHTLGEVVVVSESTCTASGQKVRYCTVEGCECAEGTNNPAVVFTTPVLGHQIVNQRAVPATCTESGLSAGSYCSRCGTVFEAQVVIEALEHNMQAVSTVDPTCTALGYTVYECANGCGKTYKEDYTDKIPHVEGTPATCTEPAVCSVCGRSYGSALGHSFTVLREDLCTPATCVTRGIDVYQCSRCEATNSVTLDFGEHTYAEDRCVIVPATCTAAGSVTYYCTVCGEGAMTQPGEPALGHNYQNGTCTRCGAADPSVTGEPTVVSEKCPKCGLNHNGRTGLWRQDGFFCKIISFFRNLFRFGK